MKGRRGSAGSGGDGASASSGETGAGPAGRSPQVGGETVRIQKFLSRAGVASRRRAEELMAQGRVRVNGVVVTQMGTQIHPDTDRVEVDGAPVSVDSVRWVMFNKPPGYLTTLRDPGNRPTVYDLLPDIMRGLRYVGRLDRETQGLLLFTNEGDVAHGFLHPSRGVEREYRARVKGVPTRATQRLMVQGVELEDGMARAHRVRLLEKKENESVLTLVLREGRKREVRRMLLAVNHPVLALQRVRFGSLTLGPLPEGQWRDLSLREVEALRAEAQR
ncbi:MAG: pseudouridine synthase [Gemmatimonadota bacterium]